MRTPISISFSVPTFSRTLTPAGRRNAKRPSHSVVQSSRREEYQSIGDSSELPSEQLQYVKIGTFGTKEVMGEHFDRTIEPPGSAMVTSLETISDVCLREILQYLDITDMVNVATTSKRLRKFSKDVIFPEAAKEVSINWYYKCHILPTLVYNRRKIVLTRENLEIAFRYIGEFVEDLKIESFRPNYILDNCPNLKKLTLKDYNCEFHETRLLQNHIESLQYLNELTFHSCDGLTNRWSSPSSISNINKLTLNTMHEDVNDHFIDCFKNLTSLSFDLCFNNWKCDDILRILNNNSHCLKRLIVRSVSQCNAPEIVARFITEKLPELEYLELSVCLRDSAVYLFELPHLKSVTLSCRGGNTVSSGLGAALRTLSDKGLIEELTISSGVFDESVENEQPPLIFHKLRKFSLALFPSTPNRWTKSQMPEVQAAEFSGLEIYDFNDLCTFIESKYTLKSIKIGVCIGNIPISFWHRIISILQESSTTKRPPVSFDIWPFELDPDVVS